MVISTGRTADWTVSLGQIRMRQHCMNVNGARYGHMMTAEQKK